MNTFGAVETGGTKIKCLIGTSPDDIYTQATFPTTNPEETLAKVIDFFKLHLDESNIDLKAIGIASFGPLDLDPASETYGFITHTPKPGWKMTNIAGHISDALAVPAYIDTDVNGAALGEYAWGAGKGIENLVYLTVGTGIGGGALINGLSIHGLIHPEMGHIRIQHDWINDPFAGSCPFHGDCLEGLASGTAIEQRWGRKGEELPDNHPAWHLEAYYLAQAIVNVVLIISPQRVIIGGGVMGNTRLYEMIRAQVKELLAGYVQAQQILVGIDAFISAPGLGSQSGVLGALALAINRHSTK